VTSSRASKPRKLRSQKPTKLTRSRRKSQRANTAAVEEIEIPSWFPEPGEPDSVDHEVDEAVSSTPQRHVRPIKAATPFGLEGIKLFGFLARSSSRANKEYEKLLQEQTRWARHLLSGWWREILKKHQQYYCYAVFLLLDGDQAAIAYVKDLGRELDQISGDSCLVIALGHDTLRRSGFDKKLWQQAIDTQVDSGYSEIVGKIFGVNFKKYPCLLVFRDLRSPQHMIVSLNHLDKEQIAEKMRAVFTIIDEAAQADADPLKALKRERNIDILKDAGRSIVSLVKPTATTGLNEAMKMLITGKKP
jgi:hypothetical protein